jgi:hypothetical protein
MAHMMSNQTAVSYHTIKVADALVEKFEYLRRGLDSIFAFSYYVKTLHLKISGLDKY